MKIILNDREEVFQQEEMTVTQLLKEKNFTYKMLVIKVNDRILKKPEYETTLVKEGDKLMVLHLVSGG